MKFKSRVGLGAALTLLMCVARSTTQQVQDYEFFPGDFDGDKRTDLLYVSRSGDLPSGIALADKSGIPQLGFQNWGSGYLGISWSLEQVRPIIGDFDGNGQDDVLLQSNAEDSSYLILSNSRGSRGAIGQLLGISQAIAPDAIGLRWSAGHHTLHVGDYNGDRVDDLLFQAAGTNGMDAIVLADSTGRLFTRTSDNCWAGGPERCWVDGEQGFNWNKEAATLAIGDFDADGKAGPLVQAQPNWTWSPNDDSREDRYPEQGFGTVFSSVLSKRDSLELTTHQRWSVDGLSTNWSPQRRQPIIGDYNGDGHSDVFLQGMTRGIRNQLVLAAANGVLQEAIALESEAGDWSADEFVLTPGSFGNTHRTGFYVQSLRNGNASGFVGDITARGVILHQRNLSAAAYSSGAVMIAGSNSMSANSVVAASKSISAGAARSTSTGVSTLAAVTPPAATTAIGATPATAEVTQNGSAAYTIPIQLPVGTAGLTRV